MDERGGVLSCLPQLIIQKDWLRASSLQRLDYPTAWPATIYDVGWSVAAPGLCSAATPVLNIMNSLHNEFGHSDTNHNLLSAYRACRVKRYSNPTSRAGPVGLLMKRLSLPPPLASLDTTSLTVHLHPVRLLSVHANPKKLLSQEPVQRITPC